MTKTSSEERYNFNNILGTIIGTSSTIFLICSMMIVIIQITDSISIVQILSTSIFVILPDTTGARTTTVITTRPLNSYQQYKVIRMTDDRVDDDDERKLYTDNNQASHTKSVSLSHLSSSITNTTIETAVAQQPTQQNRTLVIVLGSIRGGVPSWKSLCDNVLDVNMADLALLIGEGNPDKQQETTLLHERAKYVWTVPEHNDWADAMEDIPNKPNDWRDRLFNLTNPKRTNNILLGAANNIRGSGALVFMFRYYLSKKLVENNLLSQYNRFVVTRSDHYYLCVHDLNELSNEYLWVPTGSDYNGICDRHFIANNETILSALDVLPPLVRHPELYRKQLKAHRYNTERFLLLRWEQSGISKYIRRFDRNMLVVAGKNDTTRWKRKGRYMKSLGVHLKYSREYYESRATCTRRTRVHGTAGTATTKA